MRFSDLRGTLSTILQLGIGGLQLKSSSGKIRARNASDNADVAIVGSVVASSGDSIVINEDAAGSGADYQLSISRPAAGMSQNLNFVLPTSHGTANYALKTDGNGNLFWGSSAAATNLEATDQTEIAFNSTSTVAMFDLPANAIVREVEVVVDTAFNGSPSLSVGVSGELSKYLGSNQVGLTSQAGTSFSVSPGVTASASAQSLIATYSAGSATAGNARINVSYVIPS